jgi:hypothetical protein
MEDSELVVAEHLNEHVQKKKRKDNRIESEYVDEIEITDPITGKVFKHKVKVTRYKSAAEKQIGQKGISEELEGSEDLVYDWGSNKEVSSNE